MKIIDQAGPHRIVQSVKNNLIKVLILSKSMIMVLRLPDAPFFIFQLIDLISGITFKAPHESCERSFSQACNNVHMVRHHNRSIQNYFSLFFEPVQAVKHNICGTGLLKYRLSIKNCCRDKVMLIFDGRATFT